MLSISRSTVDCYFTVQCFDHEGFHQVQNCFAPDEDLCGQNVELLQSTVQCEGLNVTTAKYLKP